LGQTSFIPPYIDDTRAALENSANELITKANNKQNKCMYYYSQGTDLYTQLTFDYSIISKCVVELMAGNSNSMLVATIYCGTSGGFVVTKIVAGSGITITTDTGVVYISRTGGSAYIRITAICGNMPTVTHSSTDPTT
jgi:hypothetical protein